MAEYTFATRAELISMMVDTLNRLGSTVIPDRCVSWIKLHEARANRVIRERNMVVRATATLSEGHLRLPSDWREAQQIQLNVTGDDGVARPRPLQYVTQEHADKIRRDGQVLTPRYYTLVGNYLEVVPYPTEDLEIEMSYYKGVTALGASGTAATNWMLEKHPDYYFYGSLVHSAPYLRDDERIATWGTLAQAAQDEMLAEIERARYSGARLKTRARLRNR